MKTILKVCPKFGNVENPDPPIFMICEVHTSRGTEPWHEKKVPLAKKPNNQNDNGLEFKPEVTTLILS